MAKPLIIALRHTNWRHFKLLKLIQIKFNQVKVFEERGRPEYLQENLTEAIIIALTTTPQLLSTTSFRCFFGRSTSNGKQLLFRPLSEGTIGFGADSASVNLGKWQCVAS